MKPKKTKRMRTGDLLGMATGALVSNKLRTGLTVSGIAIGVWVVVTVMTALSAIQVSINSGLAQLGANTFQISRMPAVMTGGDGWWNYRRRPVMDYRVAYQFERLMADENVLVTPNISESGQRASAGDKQLRGRITIIGANQNYPATHNRDIDSGRFITADDVLFGRKVAVIGTAMRDQLFPVGDPLGQRIILSGVPFTVVGVLEHKGEVFGQDMDMLSIVPVTVFMQHYFNRRWNSLDIAVQAPDAASTPATQDLAIGMMRLARGLAPEEKNDFEVYSNDSLQAMFDKMAVVVGAAGLVISTIALITAGVGVMNIMLVSVTERTREIGVRKSIGARAKDILRQFLLEAFFIAQVGAVIGIWAGIQTGNFVAQNLLEVEPIMPWFWIFMAVATCAGIGVGFGLYPAWRASRLDPVEALRFE